MKKIIIFTLITALLLSACGSLPSKPAEVKPQASTSPETVTPDSEPIPQAPDYEAQKALILANKELWELHLDYDSWFYTITDLDGNGRLELITSSCQGSGLFTYSDYWELNEDLNALVHCDYPESSSSSEPDIIVDKLTQYTDPADGTNWYITEDIIRNGYSEHYTVVNAIALVNGTIITKVLCSSSHIADQGNGKEISDYHDASGNAITVEAYNSMADTVFSGFEKSDYNLDWTRVEPMIQNEISGSTKLSAASFDGGSGFHSFCWYESGTYTFREVNTTDAGWEVYVLDEEFNDALRYIRQAYSPVVSGSGSTFVRSGQWVYIYCPWNGWTGENAPDGAAYEWTVSIGDCITADIPDIIVDTVQSESVSADGVTITITKNPTGECISTGGKTWFIAHAANAKTLTWFMLSPDGKSYSLSDTLQLIPGLGLEALDGDTLAVTNVPAELNGWAAYARFENGNAWATTDPALIYVGDYVNLYAEAINLYKTAAAGNSISGNRFDVFAEFYPGTVGYKLKDLDSDGSPELIIAQGNDSNISGKGDQVYAVFTLKNGNPECVFNGWARNRYYYAGGYFINEGSGGADYSLIYSVSVKNGISIVNGGIYTDGSTKEIYWSLIGNPETGKKTPITEQQFNNLFKQYEDSFSTLGMLTRIGRIG